MQVGAGLKLVPQRSVLGGGDLGADVLSLDPLISILCALHLWVLCAAAKVGDRPRVRLSDCSCLAALPVAAPVRSMMAVLAAESWTSASHTRSWRGPHEYRLRSALPFGTLHLDRTFPSCS